jgi:hypothetical protein
MRASTPLKGTHSIDDAHYAVRDAEADLEEWRDGGARVERTVVVDVDFGLVRVG